MQGHLEKAKHNCNFLAILQQHSPNTFCDWEITALFYTALHYLRAYQKKNKKKIGESHKEFNYNLDPQNSDAILPVTQDVYNSYMVLYEASRVTRYKPVNYYPIKGLLEFKHKTCIQCVDEIRNYIKANGITIA